MQCDFELDDQGNGACRRPGCGYQVRGAKGLVISECRSPEARGAGEEPAPPTITGMLVSWVKAQARQLWCGAAVPAQEIAERHAVCNGCEYHRGGACAWCGCVTNGSPNHLTNKLALAQPDWPVITNAKGETIFECPQIAREKARSIEPRMDTDAHG